MRFYTIPKGTVLVRRNAERVEPFVTTREATLTEDDVLDQHDHEDSSTLIFVLPKVALPWEFISLDRADVWHFSPTLTHKGDNYDYRCMCSHCRSIRSGACGCVTELTGKDFGLSIRRCSAHEFSKECMSRYFMKEKEMIACLEDYTSRV